MKPIDVILIGMTLLVITVCAVFTVEAGPLPAFPAAPSLAWLQEEQPGEQTPGPVEPPEFPAGVFCQKPDPDHLPNPAHPCTCRDMDNCSKPEAGQGQGPSENNKCLQWCHKDHCHCRTECK